MSESTGERAAEFYDGLLRTKIFPKPDRAYAYEAQFRLDHALTPILFSQRPPMHFHPYQDEYISVVSGKLVVDVDGRQHILTPEDGELCVKAWSNHRLYPLYPSEIGEDGTTSLETTIRASGQQSGRAYQEDILFLENWSKYQEDVVLNNKKISLIQVLCMFDAGGSYLSPPSWLPFGRYISRFMGVLVGRWIGALMGYQPYQPEWSTDWALACAKMESSTFQRKFADRTLAK
ncbi:hypothetical protein F5Y16DRAFT_400408 [Xylariaceae sp. FL0255]|nr:hypothetical protein F5Y16DRAFT_400408 [Xylariaceae sp. FL0255]